MKSNDWNLLLLLWQDKDNLSMYIKFVDNATNFRAEELVDMCESMGIQLVHSTPYYPQGNGLA